MWRMPEGANSPLESVAELRCEDSPPRGFAWHPTEADCGISVHDSGLQQWKVAGGGAEVGQVAWLHDSRKFCIFDSCRAVLDYA